MLPSAKKQLSSIYWMSNKGDDKLRTRQKKRGERWYLLNTALCCCCLFSFHRKGLILDLKRDWREKTIHHDKFDNGSGTRASKGDVLCLHLLIGHRVWQQQRLPCWRGPSVNLALGERFHRQWLGRQPLCPKQGIVSAEECSAILADPRCVLNIKSSAVIPLAAPNTNRGLPVAVATALLSNIASSSSASL